MNASAEKCARGQYDCARNETDARRGDNGRDSAALHVDVSHFLLKAK
jgi:hypothetical protein